MRGQASSVYTIAINSSSQLVGTGGFDRVAILFDVTDPHRPQELVSLAGQLDAVSAVRFSPNHDLIAISAENTVTLWDISALSEILARPVQVACAIVGRGLNPTEWRSYVNVPYHQTCA
jgi:WD40 repeat protein